MKSNNLLLLVDDDVDDFLFIQKSIRESQLVDRVIHLKGGEELMEYLWNSPAPALIFLDLNMPKKNGQEVLKEIREYSHFRRIPIVIFTTSGKKTDIIKAYESGANSYIKKPSNLREYREVITETLNYWLNLSLIPSVEE